MMPIDRRSFLQIAGAVPLGFGLRGSGSLVPGGDDRVLLVVELVGGNDGLNTVIPVDDERYAKLRPKLAVVRKGAHALGDGTALHPALHRLAGHVAAGRGAVVHGVGYPRPDRSHFRSRDIWHTADPSHTRVQTGTTGWLGRSADQLSGKTAGFPAAAVGALEVPLALRARRANVPSLRRVEDFQWLQARASEPIVAADPMRAVVAATSPQARDDLRTFVGETGSAAVGLADDLAATLARYRPRAVYPETQLGRDLQLAARLCIAGFGARLLHTGFPGFDTHARQLPAHAGLLAQLDEALDALLQDLVAHGAADRVTVLVHSEFGRRVAENASQGTDHGAAAPVFAWLGSIRGGPHGPVPDLGRLDDGDLIASCDFRSVYADVLRWLELDATSVLGGDFGSAGLVAASVR